jgi:hypothetical protein
MRAGSFEQRREVRREEACGRPVGACGVGGVVHGLSEVGVQDGAPGGGDGAVRGDGHDLADERVQHKLAYSDGGAVPRMCGRCGAGSA